MAEFVTISEKDMAEFLKARGFGIVPNVPGTKELVYSKPVGQDLCLRVYTSIVGDASRGNGKDAIRVQLVTRIAVDGGHAWETKIVGVTKRVHRVEGWRGNLTERFDSWRELLGPPCPLCGAHTTQRTSRHGEFFGCIHYPRCRGMVSDVRVVKFEDQVATPDKPWRERKFGVTIDRDEFAGAVAPALGFDPAVRDAVLGRNQRDQKGWREGDFDSAARHLSPEPPVSLDELIESVMEED